MSQELVIPYGGVSFRVAVDASGHITDVFLLGGWWDAKEVLSPSLICRLQEGALEVVA